MIRRVTTWLTAGMLCSALCWPIVLCAQHADVLVQQVGGQLVTGSADFDTNRWTLGRRVYSGEFDGDFTVNSPGFNALAAGSSSLPAGSEALPSGAPLAWDFLSMRLEPQRTNLFFWDGLESDGQPGITAGDVAFGPLPGPNYALSLFDQSGTKFTVDGEDQVVAGGVLDNTAADGSLHRHRFYLLESGDGSGATQPVDGIYLFAMRLRMAGLEPAKPIFMVFGTPGASVAALDNAAVPWVEQHLDELVPVVLPGDYNCDGSVDAADYVVWRKTLGQTGAGLAPDGNGNHEIDHDDYAIWRANFGSAAPANHAAPARVPEPAAWTAPLMLTLAVMMRRRRRPE